MRIEVVMHRTGELIAMLADWVHAERMSLPYEGEWAEFQVLKVQDGGHARSRVRVERVVS